MSVPHVFLALPCYGPVEPYFMGSLLNLERSIYSVTAPPFKLKIEMGVGDSIVGRARNRLAARFLATDCTHLLFIDSDLVFTARDTHLLIEAAIAEGACIMCGRYAQKCAEPIWTHENFVPPPPPRPSGAVEVARAGTGFMLIDRRVLEGLRASVPELGYVAEANDIAAWNFFNAHINAYRRFVGEDYSFCDLARALKFPVFIHPAVLCRHVGRAFYPLQ